MSELMEVIIATTNKNKYMEIKNILHIEGVKFLSLSAFPAVAGVVEDGTTFEANAVKKAVEIAKATGKYVIADDSGLEVDSLGGKPGVMSARFAREHASDYENMQKLLTLIEEIPKDKRAANFKCVIAFASPEGLVLTDEGTCYGYITDKPRGENGFGYDPVFARYEDHKTFAELDSQVKSRISHRAKALEKIGIHIESYFIKKGMI